MRILVIERLGGVVRATKSGAGSMLRIVAGRMKDTMARTILSVPLECKTAVVAHKGAMTRKLK